MGPVIFKLVSYINIIFVSNVSKILAIDPKMMTIDPKMMMIDTKRMTIDPNMMTIDPNLMTIDPKRRGRATLWTACVNIVHQTRH